MMEVIIRVPIPRWFLASPLEDGWIQEKGGKSQPQFERQMKLNDAHAPRRGGKKKKFEPTVKSIWWQESNNNKNPAAQAKETAKQRDVIALLTFDADRHFFM